MSEFTKTGINSAASSRGFTVILRPSGGVEYSDANGNVHVESELLGGPLKDYVLYENSGDLKRMPAAQANEILDRITAALTFLGHKIDRF